MIQKKNTTVYLAFNLELTAKTCFPTWQTYFRIRLKEPFDSDCTCGKLISVFG